VIHREREPASMTVPERFAEIAEILAKGYVRFLLSPDCSENALADRGQSEAPCGSRATNPQSDEDAA